MYNIVDPSQTDGVVGIRNMREFAFSPIKAASDAITTAASTIGTTLGGLVTAAGDVAGTNRGDFIKRAVKNSPDDFVAMNHFFNSYKDHEGESNNWLRSL
ncbi:hypothetical protein [Sharpea azabuensis]|uniref:hypothetical protein n=1 Tax=Sharpea azabuensis TaxID=322505 RepID=UPI00156802FC|nr:hypothetical protein [Sharpea azabuensis]